MVPLLERLRAYRNTGRVVPGQNEGWGFSSPPARGGVDAIRRRGGGRAFYRGRGGALDWSASVPACLFATNNEQNHLILKNNHPVRRGGVHPSWPGGEL